MRRLTNNKLKHYAISVVLAVGFLLFSCIIGIQVAYASDWEMTTNEDGSITIVIGGYDGCTIQIPADYRIEHPEIEDLEDEFTDYILNSDYTDTPILRIQDHGNGEFSAILFNSNFDPYKVYEFKGDVCVAYHDFDGLGREITYVKYGNLGLAYFREEKTYFGNSDRFATRDTENELLNGGREVINRTYYDNTAHEIKEFYKYTWNPDGSYRQHHNYSTEDGDTISSETTERRADLWYKIITYEAGGTHETKYFTDTGEEVATEDDWKACKYPGEENQEESNQEEESSTDPEEEQYAIYTEESNEEGSGSSESQAGYSEPEQEIDPYLAAEMASQEEMYEQMSQEAETAYPQEIPESQLLGAQVNM